MAPAHGLEARVELGHARRPRPPVEVGEPDVVARPLEVVQEQRELAQVEDRLVRDAPRPAPRPELDAERRRRPRELARLVGEHPLRCLLLDEQMRVRRPSSSAESDGGAPQRSPYGCGDAPGVPRDAHRRETYLRTRPLPSRERVDGPQDGAAARRGVGRARAFQRDPQGSPSRDRPRSPRGRRVLPLLAPLAVHRRATRPSGRGALRDCRLVAGRGRGPHAPRRRLRIRAAPRADARCDPAPRGQRRLGVRLVQGCERAPVCPDRGPRLPPRATARLGLVGRARGGAGRRDPVLDLRRDRDDREPLVRRHGVGPLRDHARARAPDRPAPVRASSRRPRSRSSRARSSGSSTSRGSARSAPSG